MKATRSSLPHGFQPLNQLIAGQTTRGKSRVCQYQPLFKPKLTQTIKRRPYKRGNAKLVHQARLVILHSLTHQRSAPPTAVATPLRQPQRPSVLVWHRKPPNQACRHARKHAIHVRPLNSPHTVQRTLLLRQIGPILRPREELRRRRQHSPLFDHLFQTRELVMIGGLIAPMSHLTLSKP